MKKIISILLVLTMCFALFAGCVENGETVDTPDTNTGDTAVQPDLPEKEMTKITLSEVTHSVFYAPQYAALELGFFEEEGIEVELINGGGADKVMTSVLTGQAEIGLAGPEASIYVLLEGRENSPKVFAQLTKCDGSFIVGRTDEEFSWDILRGKTIIGGRKGGVPEMTLEYIMKKNGVVPGEDSNVDTSVQFDMMAGAFTGGNGDYVTLFEPTATEIELAGQGYILASLGEESGEIPYTAYFAAEDYMAENPDVIQGFANAVAKGQQWIAQHSGQEIAEVIAGYFPDTDVDVLAQVAERYKSIDAWNTTPVMKEESLERLEDVMEEAGELSQRVEFSDLVDNSYAEKAVEQLD